MNVVCYEEGCGFWWHFKLTATSLPSILGKAIAQVMMHLL